MPPSESAVNQQELSGDRRMPSERRLSILGALWHSSFARRRLGPRRDTDRHPVMTDWFQPQWLATSMIIMILSIVDAVITLELISRGAIEINPLMEPLVRGSGHSFALWKLGLTSMGVVVLTMVARLRVFGRVAVGSILYVVLAGYLVLVGYEFSLLRSISGL